MKEKHLVVYDYGQGGIWAFVCASSRREIEERYPELKVVSEVPAWMSEEIRARIEERETYDLDASPIGLLEDLRRQRAGGS